MGINRTDARVIDLLEERGSLTAGEIAHGAGLTSGAVTGLIDRLERAGDARRVADAEDRRRVRVEPTERVAQMAAEMYGGMAAKGGAVFGACSRDRLRLVARALRDATALTEEHVAEPREQHAGGA